MLGVPADLAELRPLLSESGYAQAALEPDLAAQPLAGDVAIGAHIDARFGAEVTDRLLEPLLGGVYAGRARELSFAAVAPELYRRVAARRLHAAARGRAGPECRRAGLCRSDRRGVDTDRLRSSTISLTAA